MPHHNIATSKNIQPVYEAEVMSGGLCGLKILNDDKCIKFWYKMHPVTFWYKKQWSTGKSIEDGRGLKHLLNQIKD